MRQEKEIGDCSQCGEGGLVCKYNRFESDELRIDAWEHKCVSCGFRQTQAFRSDDEDERDASLDPEKCPYCQRQVEV